MSASCCAPAREEPVADQPPESASHELTRATDRAVSGHVRLSGGAFLMGSEDEDVNPMDGEGPVREAVVEPFAISRCATTNDQFAAFVEDTGYVTEAERFGWSFVLASFVPAQLRAQARRPPHTPWWCAVPGATWRTPEGPGSSVADRADHPVVHVSWQDAEACATWAGGRLPTEVEWEYAARGGLDQARYPWGDELQPGGRHMCNIWQGRFPARNTVEDGYRGTAPVDAFEPNGYGLHNIAGNVWEMCADRWSTGQRSARTADRRRVIRGGSYLCHLSYCNRYRVAARTSNTADSSAGNQGFRLAYDL